MASAICFKCGCVKSGALVGCRDCNAQPRTNSEHAVSLALSLAVGLVVLFGGLGTLQVLRARPVWYLRTG